jgi:hypothetical protein
MFRRTIMSEPRTGAIGAPRAWRLPSSGPFVAVCTVERTDGGPGSRNAPPSEHSAIRAREGIAGRAYWITGSALPAGCVGASESARSSAMSSARTAPPALSAAASRPSFIIVMQKGHSVATVLAPVARA